MDRSPEVAGHAPRDDTRDRQEATEGAELPQRKAMGKRTRSVRGSPSVKPREISKHAYPPFLRALTAASLALGSPVRHKLERPSLLTPTSPGTWFSSAVASPRP